MNGRMDGWINGSMDQHNRSTDLTDVSTDGLIIRSMDQQMDKSTDGWINRWTDQQTEGSTDLWINGSKDPSWINGNSRYFWVETIIWEIKREGSSFEIFGLPI